MVLAFFRGGDRSLEHIEHEVVTMVGNCRHSFDLAMSSLVSDADITPLGEEVRSTDRAINAIEESVRRELVVHTAVHGGEHVGEVLAYLLIVKKLERVGDQAKNIFDLADEGVRFSGAPDYDRFVEFRDAVSSLFGDAIHVLTEQSAPMSGEVVRRSDELMGTFDRLVNELINADEPGNYAVPRAMLFRYLKRTCANLSSVVTTLVEGIDRLSVEDLDE